MLSDRKRIMTMESTMTSNVSNLQSRPQTSDPAVCTATVTPPLVLGCTTFKCNPWLVHIQGTEAHKQGSQVSTSAYLQRQRQMLLEGYLRKHMSLPLQARSTVLAGLEQLQPRTQTRAASADPVAWSLWHGDVWWWMSTGAREQRFYHTWANYNFNESGAKLRVVKCKNSKATARLLKSSLCAKYRFITK